MRLHRWAAVAAIIAIPVLATPASAATAAPRAGLIDCTNPPTPQNPAVGAAAVLDQAPPNPRPGDPWATPHTTTVYAQYGWAGAQWPNFDLGCGPDAARDLTDTAWSVMADGSLSTLTAAAATVTGATRVGFEPSRVTGVLDPVGHVMQDTVGHDLMPRLIGPAIAIAGLGLLTRHRRNSPRVQAEHAGWTGLVLIGAVTATAWALTVGPLIDQAVTRSLAVASQATGTWAGPAAEGASAGDMLGGSVQDAVVYRVWLAGMLGSADSPTARKYGPALWRASALTWQESQTLGIDPSKADDITSAKQQAFRDTAAKVKDEDPAAYAYLSGHRNYDRWLYSLLGWAALAAIAPLAAVAALLLLWGVTVVRVALWLIPVVAVAAVIPRYRPLMTRTISYAVSSLVTAVVFGAVNLLWVSVVGVIIAPGSGHNPVATMLVLGVAQVALVRVLHPWRRIRPAATMVGQVAGGTSGAVRDGWSAAGRPGDADGEDDEPPATTSRQPARPTDPPTIDHGTVADECSRVSTHPQPTVAGGRSRSDEHPLGRVDASPESAAVLPQSPSPAPKPAGEGTRAAAGIAVTAAAAAATGGASAAATVAKAAASRAAAEAALRKLREPDDSIYRPAGRPR